MAGRLQIIKGVRDMKRLFVLGSTGMLGNAVTKYFTNNPLYELFTTYRNDKVAFKGNAIKFDILSDSLDSLPADFDYLINCIGIIKPFMAQDPVAAIKINSLSPWLLSEWCNRHSIKMIHITTDCVYSGKKGKYIESDLHDALDDYGKSKSLGECKDTAMVIRTSIIGEEIHKDASLIAWAKKQQGKTISGFSTHFWNGITTKEYAKACDKIIQNDWYKTGLFHIFAQDDVTKLDMMHMFNSKFGLNMTIEEKSPEKVDRTLRTEFDLCPRLNIPTVEQMIKEI